MNHEDHLYLLRDGVPSPGGTWADLGSGGGAFTLALADLLGAGGEIYSVDLDRRTLAEQERAMTSRFHSTLVHYIAADFSKPLELPPLAGIIMANSLHYQRDKGPVLQLLRGYLQPGGRLIMVEYNSDKGNPWVPYPLSYASWEALARRNGYADTRLLARLPSRFLGEIYSAVSLAA